MVRPLATARLVMSPADRRTSACSPGRSIVARAAPACGTGRMNEPRPGLKTSGPPHSSVSANGAGPAINALSVWPSATSGTGRPPAVASTSVVPLMQRHAADAALQDLARERENATRRFAIDHDLEIGARHDGGDRRRGRSRRRARREIEQPVVFGERHRHRSRLVDRTRPVSARDVAA